MSKGDFKKQLYVLLSAGALISFRGFAAEVNLSAEDFSAMGNESAVSAMSHPGNPGGNPGGHPGNPGGNPGGHPGNPGGNPGGHPGHPGGNPGGHPGSGYGHDHNGHYPSHPVQKDPHGNVVNPEHSTRLTQAQNRGTTVIMRDSRASTVVRTSVQSFRSIDRDRIVTRFGDLDGCRSRWRDRYRFWWSYGCYGGFYWAFNPFYDIDDYFWNAAIYWLWVAEWDDYYYRLWYGLDYDNYPELREPFPYVGVYFPTMEFRDLNLDVSMMVIPAQIDYRRDLRILVDRLNGESLSRGGMALGVNDIVINHFQILPGDSAVVVEGYVDQPVAQFAFKAILDLNDSDETMVFVPGTLDAAPTAAELEILNQFNDRIYDLGGLVEQNLQ